jgi:hypothetical protein
MAERLDSDSQQPATGVPELMANSISKLQRMSLPESASREVVPYLGLLALCAAGVAWLYISGFGFVVTYANEDLDRSADWSMLHTTHHLPGYSFIVAALRSASGGTVPIHVIAHIVAVVTWLAAIRYVGQSLQILSPTAKPIGVLLFALFPFVTLSEVVVGASDPLGWSLLAAAVLFLLRQSWYPFCAVTMVALLVHKVLWPFFLLMNLVAVFERKYPLRLVLLSGLPLIAFWLYGFALYRNPLWIVAVHFDAHMVSRTGLPFDGLLGVFERGGVNSLVKGVTLWTLFVVNAYAFYAHVRARNFLMATLVIPIEVLLLIANQDEVWLAMRMAPITILPLTVLMARSPFFLRWVSQPGLYRIAFVSLLITQGGFLYYTAAVFPFRPR